jgi:protein-L-isoaspartate(D-aspartate) O-methyltransferase
MGLASALSKNGYLKDPEIIRAFMKINRSDFLPHEYKKYADENRPLEIGWGQTNSQPLTVALMFELLEPKIGQKILDVGSGSGWTAALLSEIVGAGGKVYGVEIIPELREFGEKNASKYNFVKKGIAKFVLGDGSYGLEKYAPYDRILVSASAQKIPVELKKQLKVGGIIVIPIKSSIWKIKKLEGGNFEEKEFPGFAFVPLV